MNNSYLPEHQQFAGPGALGDGYRDVLLQCGANLLIEPEDSDVPTARARFPSSAPSCRTPNDCRNRRSMLRRKIMKQRYASLIACCVHETRAGHVILLTDGC
jgi:hypothetical protein